MDALGMYIARVTPLDREDAAETAKKLMLRMSLVYPLSRWCIASLYIYHFSSVIDFFSKKYIVSNLLNQPAQLNQQEGSNIKTFT